MKPPCAEPISGSGRENFEQSYWLALEAFRLNQPMTAVTTNSRTPTYTSQANVFTTRPTTVKANHRTSKKPINANMGPILSTNLRAS
jgi:hypothetical protein